MEDNYSISVNATKQQIIDFKGSLLWADMLRELSFWAEGFDAESDTVVDRIAKENLSTPAALTLIGSIDGRKKAVAYFSQILDIFLSTLEGGKDDTKYNETE